MIEGGQFQDHLCCMCVHGEIVFVKQFRISSCNTIDSNFSDLRIHLVILFAFCTLLVHLITSDYYKIDDLLTPEEQAIRLSVRECMEKDVAPIMAEEVIGDVGKDDVGDGGADDELGEKTPNEDDGLEQELVMAKKGERTGNSGLGRDDDGLSLDSELVTVEDAESMTGSGAAAKFPFQIIPKLGALRIAGGTIKVLNTYLNKLFLTLVFDNLLDGLVISLLAFFLSGLWVSGLSITANAFATAEIARIDASCSTFFLVHSSLAMLTIGLSPAGYSSLFICMLKGLTEPDYGSDASALRATATEVKDFNLLICFYISVKWYYHALLVFGCHGSDHAISRM
ncbi:hypothetical protein DVH24_036179 [Malus domestica]|uniref:Uncharacterized protein n=1 Tax=Malus domestica TaxID=3750 RepID=A0A498IDX3_MALDO|nr:hypothetical protein DVH24_036179 [Malus domestica]